MFDIGRRDFITFLSAAVAWPLAVEAQERMRRIGVLMGIGESDPEGQARITAFLGAPEELKCL